MLSIKKKMGKPIEIVDEGKILSVFTITVDSLFNSKGQEELVVTAISSDMKLKCYSAKENDIEIDLEFSEGYKFQYTQKKSLLSYKDLILNGIQELKFTFRAEDIVGKIQIKFSVV